MEDARTDKKKIILLNSYLDICDIHASRLKMAHSYIKHLCPMAGSTFFKLQDNEVAYIELLINRFVNLQDVIGAKIFPILADLSQPETKGSSFLDILHQLEKLGLLPSSKLWIDMRELRNHLTHEYPEHPDFMAKNCNQAIQASQELVMYWEVLKKKAQKIKEEWDRQLS